MDIPAPGPSPESASESESAPAALADLIAAGLVTHEMIGDPARLAGEAAALETLCGLVSGSVWRIEPFHYAFRVEPGALGASLGASLGAPHGARGAGVDAQASALEAALQAALGADAVWVNAADLVPAAPRSSYAGPGAPDAPLPDAPLLLLRAGDEAQRAALEVAGPEAQAVIGARFALATARLAAGLGAEGRLAERLAAVETRQAAILAALEAEAVRAGHARAELKAEQDAALDRLAGAIAALAGRIDTAAAVSETMAETMAEAMAGMTAAAARAAEETTKEMAGRLAELAAFRETVGLALAEFLAEIERRTAAPMPVRVPQFL